jgi:hypothetical protein
VRGKIFAMLVRGELVVKLPKQRVDQLVDSNTGTRFERGQGRPMKEWLSVPPRHESDWEQLVGEALKFVKSAGR